MFRYAENLAHSADCRGKVIELETAGSFRGRFVCIECGLVWNEQPISVLGDCGVALVNDDDFLRAFGKWNATLWFSLAADHQGWCVGEGHEEIIGERLVNVCFTCGMVWESPHPPAPSPLRREGEV